jgi:preprotein translocase subunit SecF
MKVINFMGRRKLALAFSVLLLLVSIGSFVTRQLNWGLDFTGGTLVEAHYSETVDLDGIRSGLAGAGYPGAVVVAFRSGGICVAQGTSG